MSENASSDQAGLQTEVAKRRSVGHRWFPPCPPNLIDPGQVSSRATGVRTPCRQPLNKDALDGLESDLQTTDRFHSFTRKSNPRRRTFPDTIFDAVEKIVVVLWVAMRKGPARLNTSHFCKLHSPGLKATVSPSAPASQSSSAVLRAAHGPTKPGAIPSLNSHSGSRTNLSSLHARRPGKRRALSPFRLDPETMPPGWTVVPLSGDHGCHALLT